MSKLESYERNFMRSKVDKVTRKVALVLYYCYSLVISMYVTIDINSLSWRIFMTSMSSYHKTTLWSFTEQEVGLWWCRSIRRTLYYGLMECCPLLKVGEIFFFTKFTLAVSKFFRFNGFFLIWKKRIKKFVFPLFFDSAFLHTRTNKTIFFSTSTRFWPKEQKKTLKNFVQYSSHQVTSNLTADVYRVLNVDEKKLIAQLG